MIDSLSFPWDTRIRIISDIHLGHKKSLFRTADDLAPLLDDCDVLICNGDTAETKEGPYQREGLAQLDNLRNLCKNKGKELVIIGGNHDPDTPIRAVSLRGGQIFLTHGDALFKTGAPWGREYLQNKKKIWSIIHSYPEAHKKLPERLAMNREVAAAVPAILSRRWKCGKWINFFLHAAWPPERPVRILGSWLLYRKLAGKFAEQYVPGCKVFITGHMHRRSLFHHDDRIYINTGAFFKYARPWLVDIEGNNLTVRNIIPPCSPGPITATCVLPQI